jgi:hypothetical protein
VWYRYRTKGQQDVIITSGEARNIRDQIVIMKQIGRGASGVVKLGLHVPSLTVRLDRECIACVLRGPT